MPSAFSEVIDAFGGPAAYAAAVGMTPGAAKQAKRRDSIAAEWFAATARAAREHGHKDITIETLARLAEQRRTEAA